MTLEEYIAKRARKDAFNVKENLMLKKISVCPVNQGRTQTGNQLNQVGNQSNQIGNQSNEVENQSNEVENQPNQTGN